MLVSSVTTIAMALAATPAATHVVQGGAAARSPSAARACSPRHSHEIARSRGARVFSVEHGEGSEYGVPTTLYGCLLRRGRAVRLASFADTDAATVRRVRFAGALVAFAVTVIDVPCSKYTADPCRRDVLRVVDLRSGRVLPPGAPAAYPSSRVTVPGRGNH